MKHLLLKCQIEWERNVHHCNKLTHIRPGVGYVPVCERVPEEGKYTKRTHTHMHKNTRKHTYALTTCTHVHSHTRARRNMNRGWAVEHI